MERRPTLCGECGEVIVLLGGVVATPDEVERCDRCNKPVCESIECQDFGPDERLCATCQAKVMAILLGVDDGA